MYFLADGQHLVPAGSALQAFAVDVAAGTARYHLYFLLVTMQMYLVFPLLRRLVHGTRRGHSWLLAAAAAYQVGFYAAVQHNLTAGPLTFWLHHPSQFLPSYRSRPAQPVESAADRSQPAPRASTAAGFPARA